MVLLSALSQDRRKNFLVARNAAPADFDNVAETEDNVEQLKLRCAVLSDILWWKTQFMRAGLLRVDRLRLRDHLSAFLRLGYVMSGLARQAEGRA